MPNQYSKTYDVAIIGGGINGCGCAADAALRGLSVILIEQDDLASKTSSSSTKLIHGGLRYLEYAKFSLVKKSLSERHTLMNMAPHLVRPLPIVLPHTNNTRSIWLLRAGLFLYDHLQRHTQWSRSQFLTNLHSQYFNPLKSSVKNGFIFYDCATNDARLTLANAMQAKRHGATILTQTKLISASTSKQLWHLKLKNSTDSSFQIKAKAVINAAGPWVESVCQQLNIPLTQPLSFVKGSHIVVRALYEGDHAYLLQHTDQRVVFVIPYHGYSLIGTTELSLSNPIDPINIESTEIDYLLSVIQHYFKTSITKEDIITSWAGIRTLLSNTGRHVNALSREFFFQFCETPLPSVTIYSGKLTTYRRLSVEVIDKLKAIFPNLPHSKTQTTPLPGAEIQGTRFKEFCHQAQEQYYWLEAPLLERYLSLYGTQTEHLLRDCRSKIDLGIHFGHTLYQVEVDYLIQHEWAKTCDDILWRRTNLGLSFHGEDVLLLHEYLQKS